MTITVKKLIPCKQLENSLTNQLFVTAIAAMVDKATVVNTSLTDVNLSIHLVGAGGSPDDTNLLIKDESIAPNQTYLCPEIIGHVLETGESIHTVSSAAASLTFCLSGRLLT